MRKANTKKVGYRLYDFQVRENAVSCTAANSFAEECYRTSPQESTVESSVGGYWRRGNFRRPIAYFTSLSADSA